MKKLALILLTLVSLNFKGQQVKYYLTDQAGQPWGSPSNVNSMNAAFGVNNWTQGFFQTINVTALFQPSVCLIYCDGGSTNANAMNSFLIANMTAIQAWVFAGGRLFLNAGPNQGGNMNYGFGGVQLTYFQSGGLGGPYSPQGYAAANPAHPVYTSGCAPVTATLHTGNYYCHGHITGPGLTPIVCNTVAGTPWQTFNGALPPGAGTGSVICASKPWGSGMCLFGSMTNTSFHSPNPSANNLRTSMLCWLAVCCQQPTITTAATQTAICSGQTTTLTGGGAGNGGTYTITPGNIVSTTAAVSPAQTTTYTIAGTNTNACTGSQTIVILVNPTPTVIPGNNAPICKGSVLNLTCNLSAGNPVLYNWNGPNGYTSPFQNPQVVNATPLHTGNYTVTVSSVFPEGTCTAAGVTSVIVVNSNSIAVTHPTVCQNAPLVLTSTVAGASSFTWNGPGTYVSNLQNPLPITPATPLNSGNYTLTAAFTASNTTLVCTTSAIENVSVVATSPLTLTLPANICEKNTAVISVTANPSPLTYSWSGPNGYNSTGTSTTIVGITPAQSGIYNVLGTWAIGNVSCNIGAFGQINVVGVPNVVVNTPPAVCNPANVSLTSNAPGAVSYLWNGPNSFTSNIPNPLLNMPATTASGIYTVTAAFTNGQLMCYNSNTTQVIVNPSLPFVITPYKQVCFSSTYTIGGPTGASGYTWTGANGFTDNNQVLAFPSVQPLHAGTYTLSVNLGPCITSAVTQIDVLTPINFTYTPGNVVICDGDSVALKAGCSGGSQNYAYTWNPQQWLGSPTGSVQYGHPQGTTIYNVMAYDIACPNYSLNSSFTVTVNKGPAPDLQLTKNEGCEPLCVHLNSQTQGKAVNIVYDMGNGETFMADDFDYCYTSSGTFNMKVITKGTNGCTSSYVIPAPMIVNPLPHTEVSWTPDPVTTTENNVTFLPSHMYGPVVRYEWQFQGTNGVGGYDSATVKNPVRMLDHVGKYPVLLISTTDKGCSDTIFKVIEVRDEFAIYVPNAFTPNGDGHNDIFNIKGVGLKAEGFSMEIYNRWGDLIYSTKDILKGWDGKVKDLNGQTEVYVYKIKAMGANGEGKKEYVGHVTLLK